VAIGNPTMRVKYSALIVVNSPLPKVETNVAAAMRATIGCRLSRVVEGVRVIVGGTARSQSCSAEGRRNN
jgi:hypothetical protein